MSCNRNGFDPESHVALQASDALLNALTSDGPRTVVETKLTEALVAWRASVESEPLPNPLRVPAVAYGWRRRRMADWFANLARRLRLRPGCRRTDHE